MVAENEEIAVGALGGAFLPAIFQEYQPGKTEVAGLESLPEPLDEKPVLAGTFAGLGGIVLGVMGARGSGPFAGNSSAVAMSTAFGAASLGTTLTYAMYPVEERAEAAGGEVEIQKASQSSMEIEVGEVASGTTSTEEESEEEETTIGSIGFK